MSRRRAPGGGESPPSPAASASKSFLRIVILAAVGGVALLLAAAIGAWLMVSTTGGSRWLVGQLLQRVPAKLEATVAGGDLLGPLVLSGVRYEGEPTPEGTLALGIEQLEVDWRPRSLLTGKLELTRILGQDVTLDMPPSTEPIELVDVFLPLEIDLPDLVLTEFDLLEAGESLARIDRLSLAAEAAGRRVEIGRLEVTSDRGDLTMSGTVTTAGSYPVRLALTATTTLAELDVAAGGSLGGDLDRLSLQLQVDSPVAVQLEGSIGAPLDVPQFDLVATLVDLDPRAVDPGLPQTRLDGSVEFTGVPDNYRLIGDIALRSVEFPDGQWAFDGKGDLESFDLGSLSVKLSSGEIGAVGRLAWSPEITWDLEVTARGADPALLLPEWPGRIDFDGRTSGRWTEVGPDLVASVSTLEGELREHPIRGELELAVEGDSLELPRLLLHTGDAHLEASGRIDHEFDLSWRLTAESLESVYPGLRGRFSAEGSATGSRDQPHITLDLSGDQLGYEEISLASIRGDADLTWNSEAPVRIMLEADDLAHPSLAVGRVRLVASGDLSELNATLTGLRLSSGELEADRLEIDLLGSQERHELIIEAVAGERSFDLHANGGLLLESGSGLAEGVWSGNLDTSNVDLGEFGRWVLSEPVQLDLAPDRWSVTAACWRREGPSEVCFEGAGEVAGAWQVEGGLEDLPLELLSPLLPDEIGLAGSLDAGLSAAMRPDGQITADLTATSTGSLSLNRGEVRGRPREFEARVVEGRIDEAGAYLEVEAQLPASRWDFQLSLPGYRSLEAPRDSQELTGSFRAFMDDLSPLEPFLLGVRNLSGSAEADTEISGTLGSPALVGEISLNAAMNLPSQGIRLDRVDLRLTGDRTETLRLTGEIESNRKILRLSGTSPTQPAKGRPAVLRLDGEEFKIVDTPLSRVWASPALQMTVHPGRVEIGGEIDIPRAEIEVAEAGRDAVPVSADVQIVGGPDEPAARGPEVVADVRLNLGNNITVSGPGFNARLGGGIRVVDDGSRSPVGHGQVSISRGRFRGYGQDLQIEEGRVIFTGGPIGNPALRVPAFRRARDGVIAGVRISGTLETPTAELYSIPPLPDSEILSYILTGRGSRPGDGSTGDSAAASLGLAQSTAVLNQMGLQNVSLRTDGALNETEVVLGRYLSPGLYVSYGIGVFEQLNTLRLRYEFTDSWSVEVDSNSQESGADLFYTFEN